MRRRNFIRFGILAPMVIAASFAEGYRAPAQTDDQAAEGPGANPPTVRAPARREAPEHAGERHDAAA